MHMIKFSVELQNAEISPVTLLESDSITFHDKKVILSAILKKFGIVIGNICSGVSLQYSFMWVDWTARTSTLQACSVREKGAILQIFFKNLKF